MTIVEAALAYAQGGWHVFPCRHRGKVPLTPNGFKDATVDPDRIRQWWQHHPDANIGIATGTISGIWVLDIDGETGAQNLARLANTRRLLPATATATTGNGTHHYYRCTGPVRSRTAILPGIDIRGDGGYVIAPPSIHPSGRRYAWETQ